MGTGGKPPVIPPKGPGKPPVVRPPPTVAPPEPEPPPPPKPKKPKPAAEPEGWSTAPVPENAPQTASTYKAPDYYSSDDKYLEYIDKRAALEERTFGKIMAHADDEGGSKFSGLVDLTKENKEEFRDLLHRYIKASNKNKKTAFKMKPKVPEPPKRPRFGMAQIHNVKAFPKGDRQATWAKEAIDEFMDLVPRQPEQHISTVRQATRYRGCLGFNSYSYAEPDIHFIGMRPFGSTFPSIKSWKTTVVHELTHSWEAGHPRVLKMREAFMRRRTSGMSARKAGKAKQFDDDFMRGYTGFFKNGQFSEALACGVEAIYEDPLALYLFDKQFFYFIVSVLRGVV